MTANFGLTERGFFCIIRVSLKEVSFMKFTSKILSIPPYISTTWDNVASLTVEPEDASFRLFVHLKDEVIIEVPSLSKELLEEIFEAHLLFSEKPKESSSSFLPFGFRLPLKDEKGSVLNPLEHDPNLFDAPPIPEELLNKISALSQMLPISEIAGFKPFEPDCNCIYCQIARALHNKAQSDEDFEISEEDLRFKDAWEVKQSGDKLYTVTNTLDPNEHYNVFLGSPIGCTCGSKSCDHIVAVLSS